MAQEKKVNVNQVNYRVYEELVRAMLGEYSNTFNQVNPERMINFNLSISPATISTHDVLLRQNKFKNREEIEAANIKDEKVELRYLRLVKFFESVKYHFPILDEFKPGTVYQKLDIVNKVWQEEKFEEGDIIMQDDLDKEHIRIATTSREQEVIVHQQSMRLNNKKEILNDKWWKRILYLDLISTLTSKGIEYSEALTLIKRGEEEKAVLAKELGDNAKKILEDNKIVIRKAMPDPLTKQDKEYVAKMKVEREKDSKTKNK